MHVDNIEQYEYVPNSAQHDDDRSSIYFMQILCIVYWPCRYLILMVYFDFKGLWNYFKNMHFRSSGRTFDLITTLDLGFVQAFISSQPDYDIRNYEYPKRCGINS